MILLVDCMHPASPLITCLSLPHLSYRVLHVPLDIHNTCKCCSVLSFINFSCYLQALAELESHWFTDVDEISSDSKDIKSAFFFDLQQQEVRKEQSVVYISLSPSLLQSTIKQFELLCCLLSVDHTDSFGAATQLQ